MAIDLNVVTNDVASIVDGVTDILDNSTRAINVSDTTQMSDQVQAFNPFNFDYHKNLAYSTILTAPSPASSGTSLVVQSGDGAKFSTGSFIAFNAIIWPNAVQPTPANSEIVRVTALSTDTFTITRTQEGSSARTVIVGDQIAATITAKTLTDIETDVNVLGPIGRKNQTDYLATTGNDDDFGQNIQGPIQITSARTITAKPTNFGGTPLYIRQDQELNYVDGLNGPGFATGFVGPSDGRGRSPMMTGPRSWVTLEGTIQYDVSAGITGMPLMLQAFQTYKNQKGTALNLGSSYSMSWSPQMVADGATIGWTPGDYPITSGATGSPILPARSMTGVVDNQWFGTINGGVGNWGSSYSIGFNSFPVFHGNITFGTRIDFFSNELFIDSDGANRPVVAAHYGHYIHPLSMARQNISLYADGVQGFAPASVGIWGLYSRADAYIGGTLLLDGVTNLAPTSTNVTAPKIFFNATSTLNWSVAGVSFGMFNYSTIHQISAAPNAFLLDSTYVNEATYANLSSLAMNWSGVQSFIAGYTKTVDTQTGRNISAGFLDKDFQASPTYTSTASGTFTAGTRTGFESKPVINSTGSTLTSNTSFNSALTVTLGTVTTHTHYAVADPTGAGAVGTQTGLSIPSLTKATTNIGINNLSSLLQKGAFVGTPTVVTVSTNAGTVPVTAFVANFTNSSAATMTVTIATSGASDGQMMIVRVFDATAASQTISWVNTENGEGTVPAASTGVTTTCKSPWFMFNSATSKWRCIKT